MKSGLWAEGVSDGGSSTLGRIAGQEVRESGDRPASAAIRRAGMLVKGEAIKGVLITMGDIRI
jgi:hypothetical protein